MTGFGGLIRQMPVDRAGERDRHCQSAEIESPPAGTVDAPAYHIVVVSQLHHGSCPSFRHAGSLLDAPCHVTWPICVTSQARGSGEKCSEEESVCPGMMGYVALKGRNKVN